MYVFGKIIKSLENYILKINSNSVHTVLESALKLLFFQWGKTVLKTAFLYDESVIF